MIYVQHAYRERRGIHCLSGNVDCSSAPACPVPCFHSASAQVESTFLLLSILFSFATFLSVCLIYIYIYVILITVYIFFFSH